MMNNYLYDKCLRIIRSCETRAQCATARVIVQAAVQHENRLNDRIFSPGNPFRSTFTMSLSMDCDRLLTTLREKEASLPKEPEVWKMANGSTIALTDRGEAPFTGVAPPPWLKEVNK